MDLYYEFEARIINKPNWEIINGVGSIQARVLRQLRVPTRRREPGEEVRLLHLGGGERACRPLAEAPGNTALHRRRGVRGRREDRSPAAARPSLGESAFFRRRRPRQRGPCAPATPSPLRARRAAPAPSPSPNGPSPCRHGQRRH